MAGDYGETIIIYGSNGAYYSFDDGCQWKDLTSDAVVDVAYNSITDFILLLTDDLSDYLKIFSPGNSIKNFEVEESVSAPDRVWFWGSNLQYIAATDQLEEFTPVEPTCKRFIDYNGPLTFELDKNGKQKLNITIKEVNSGLIQLIPNPD